jgi:taurine dioxygenase
MLEVRKLSDRFGAEIHGVDLSRPLTEETYSEIERTFFAGKLAVIRGQSLTAPQFHAFACRFGRPEPHVIDQFHHPQIADILILSNVVTDGKPTGLADGGTYFHSDYSYLQTPARCTLLYSIQVPRVGGDTLFADQCAAYDNLPEDMKAQIDSLVVRHRYGNRDDLDIASRTAASALTDAQQARMGWVFHPLVRHHPVTGRKALYAVSGSSFGIVGIVNRAGLELLNELKRHATQPKYIYRLSYGVGDVVIWDNAALLHSATLTDPGNPRTLWRITVKEQ